MMISIDKKAPINKTMDLVDYGLLALFIGDLNASAQTNIDLATIEHCRKQVSHHTSRCFEKLKDLILELISANGMENISECLSLPIPVLKRLYSNHSEPPVQKPPKTEFYEEPLPLALQQKRPRPPPCKHKFLEKLESLTLQERVRILYEKRSISTIAIQKLYDLPNVHLVHEWGGFTRRPQREREAALSLQSQIRTLQSQGKNNKTIVIELGIAAVRLTQLCSDCHRTKPVYSAADVKRFLSESRVAKLKREAMAAELGVPYNVLRRWVEGPRSALQLPWYSSDDEGHSLDKVQAVEGFFLLGNEELVGEHYGLPPSLVKKWAVLVLNSVKRPENFTN